MTYLGLAPSDAETQKYLDAYVQFYAKKVGEASPEMLSRKNDTEALKNIEQEAYADLLHDLYKNLDTLDQKASALLSYCGLVIAVNSILLSGQFGMRLKLIAYGLTFAAAVSALMAMRVIFVQWASAEKIGNRSLEQACCKYFQERGGRTRFYQASWCLIFLVTLIMSLFILLDGTLPD